MTKDLNFSLTLSVDKKDGESNLQAFNRTFKAAMQDIGKSAEDIDAFSGLVADLVQGKRSVEELDAETRQLYNTYKEGAQLAADKDILGLRAHADIQQEIDATRAAYERLKTSGTLSQQELAQAALVTENRIRDLKKQTNGWVESLEGAKGSLAALAGSAAGVSLLVGQAIDFESAMADVRKVVDATDQQFDDLNGRIKQMSTELPIAAEGLAQIAAAGGQLGVPIDQLDQFVELAAKVSVAFNLTAQQAGEAIAKLSNIFNIPIQNVEQLGDAINVLGNTTAAREADILDVLTRIGGTASQFKLTAEQSAALAATMIEMGATSEVAGTGINALLSKLQTANVQGADFQAALEGIGLSATQLADNIRDNPQQALTEFLRTLSQLDDQSRAETLTRLFGQEYQDDISRLLNGLDKYQASLNRITDAGNTAGAMQKEFAARMQTTEAQIQLMQNGLNEIAINLGSIFLPAIRQAAIGIGSVSNAIAGFVEANPAIAAIATSLGTVAVSAGALRLLFLSLGVVGSKAFGNIRNEVQLTRLSLTEMSASVGKVGAAVRVVGGLFAAWSIGKDIGTQLSEQFEVVRLAGVRLAQGFTILMEAARAAIDALMHPGSLGEVWDEFNANLKQINQTYAEMYEYVDSGQDVIDKNTQALDDMGSAADNAGQKLRDAFSQIDLTSTAGVLEFTKQLDTAAGKASVLNEELQKWISSANSSDLSNFQQGLSQAFEQGKLSAEDLNNYNNQVLQASFNALGLTAETALGKISPAALEAIRSVGLIEQTLDSLSITGAQRMQALEQAITAAIGKADSTTAVDALSAKIYDLGDAGQLSAAQIKRLNDAINAQTETIHQATPGIQSIEEAMSRLGLTSSAELQKSADAAKAVVDQLKEMKAPVEDQKAAFVAYAQKAVEANNGVVSAELDAQAAVAGVRDQVQQLASAHQNTGQAAQQAAQQTTVASHAAATAATEAAAAVQQSGGDLKNFTAAIAEYVISVRDEMAQLSDAALNMFNGLTGGPVTQYASEVDQIRQSLAAAHEELGKIASDNLKTFDATGITGYANAINAAQQQTLIAYNEQQLKLAQLNAAIDDGSVSGEQLVRRGEAALRTFTLLDEQQLSGLRSAIAAARSEMEQLADSAESTLVSLQNQLDQLKGNTETVQQRNYEQKRQELQQQIEDAQAAGNQEAVADLRAALKVLNQIRAEQKAQNQADSSSSTTTTNSNTTKTSSSGGNNVSGNQESLGTGSRDRSSEQRAINIHLNNKTATVYASNNDANSLVSILKEASVNAAR
ncbi:phage tail tape measure protein [Gynuella sp.]|uniref:phage tail tape measure protein n=1 Tax=Gynuella sp. TaxID=2969146 RepID=UPI003D14011E